MEDMTTVTKTRQLKRYRLLTGGHAVHKPVGDPDANNVQKFSTSLVKRKPGHEPPIIETTEDLLHFNRAGEAPKYELVVEAGPTQSAPARDEFDNMSIDQLRAFAAEEELDLGDLKLKRDIIQAIRSHVPARR